MTAKNVKLTEAEYELLMMLRNTDHFRSIEIAIKDGSWHVQSHIQQGNCEPIILIGSHATFDGAWAIRRDPRETGLMQFSLN